MQKFIYTKDDGSATDRTLHLMPAPVANQTAIDLTALSEEVANKVVRLYADWDETVNKPYKKLEAAFRKEKLQTFEAFLKANSVDEKIEIKSFKPTGLVAVV